MTCCRPSPSPSDTSAVRVQGANQAFEGTTVLSYDESTDTLTNSQTDLRIICREGRGLRVLRRCGRQARL